MKKTKQILSLFLSVCMIISCMVGMSATAYATPADTLLTTLTFGGSSTYSETTKGVVSVTATNVRDYDSTYGWLWFDSLSVTAKEGYTITKCRFIQNSKTPLDDDLAPFSIDMQRDDPTDYPCSVITSTGKKGGFMDGVTSIEVYGTSAHTHSFTYSATGATITATCSAADCSLTGSKATLTLVKPTLTTYGGTGDATATLTGLDAFNAATGLNVGATDIKYYEAEEIIPGYKRAGGELAQAPTDVGEYFVGLTLSNVKISESETEDVKVYVPYTISKGAPTITIPPTASAITYGQKLSNSTLSGGAASVVGTFEWKTPTTAPTVADSNSTEYDVVFTPTDTTNYNSAETKVKLTVNKADPTTPTGLTAKTGQTLNDVALPTGWTWADDTTTSVGEVGDNIFKANFAVNENYNAVSNVDVTIKVSSSVTYTRVAAKAATCTATGNKEYYTGSDGKLYTKSGDTYTQTTLAAVTIAKTAHTLTAVAAVDAKCTTDGTKAHYKCSVCEKLFEDADGKTETTADALKVTKLGHNYVNGKCTRCGETDPDINKYSPVIPTYIPTTTTTTDTTTTDIKNYNITGKQDETNESALTWDDIPDASAYSLYIEVGGKYVYVQDLGKATNADVVRATNGKYYVSTGKDYTIYEYDSKKGTFNKTGTLNADDIDSVKKANNVTENFMVKYTVNGTESTESNSYKTSVSIYYKPALGITAGDGFVRVTWAKVDGAEKYRAYKVVNDKLKFITETDKLALRVNGTKAGREYAYAVKAFVDGKWTEAYKSDAVSITAK